jgi:nitroreductase
VPVFNQFQQIVPLLGIPDGLDVLAILPFGYPIRAVSKGKKRRKPLNEVAYRERFGQPL